MFHVKHIGADERLSGMLLEAGVELDPTAAAHCVEYLEAVITKNESVNLTAVSEFDAALRIHLLDSLIVLKEVTAAPPGPLLDLGSGGGFPGVPIAIASGRETTLLDSVRKKTDAVDECIAKVGRPGLVARALWGRAEEVAIEKAHYYSVVTARAVAELPILLELASPLLGMGGRLIAMKGDLTDEEASRGAAAASIVGMRVIDRRRYVLPRGGENRTVVVYEQTGKGTVKLPRRVGMASKRPLA